MSKAPGPDHICNKVLKICKDQLAGVFQRLFQLSIDQGAIPKLWKTSIIVPLPKVKNPTEINNYRPIALTCSNMKCFKTILLKWLFPLTWTKCSLHTGKIEE